MVKCGVLFDMHVDEEYTIKIDRKEKGARYIVDSSGSE
jgi:hypothetical protein